MDQAERRIKSSSAYQDLNDSGLEHLLTNESFESIMDFLKNKTTEDKGVQTDN
jgi:hypothetical protein